MLRLLILSSTIITLILSFALGFFTFVRNPRSKVNLLWFLTMMAVSVWTLGYVLTLFTKDLGIAYITSSIVYFGVTFIPILFFHFLAIFLYKDIKLKFLIIFGYIILGVVIYLTLATDFILLGVQYREGFGYHREIMAGAGLCLYLLYFFSFIFFGLVLLIQGLFNNDGIRKKQIIFILISSVIAFTGGSFNIVLDLIGTYPYGQLVIWVFPLLITYGIFIEEIKLKIKF